MFQMLPRSTNIRPLMSTNSRPQLLLLPSNNYNLNLNHHSLKQHQQLLFLKLGIRLHQPVAQTPCTVLPRLWRQSNVLWVTYVSMVVVVVVDPSRRIRIVVADVVNRVVEE